MALKSYESGMTNGKSGDTGGSKATQGYGGSVGRNSRWALENSTGAETLSGDTATGKFVPVSLSDTSPINLTALNKNEGDRE